MSEQAKPESAAPRAPDRTVKRPRHRRWLHWAGVGWIVLLGLFVALYSVYVTRHKHDLEAYYLRVLAVTASNAEDTIDRLVLNVTNAVGVKDMSGALEQIPEITIFASDISESDSPARDIQFYDLKNNTPCVEQIRDKDNETIRIQKNVGWIDGSASLAFRVYRDGSVTNAESPLAELLAPLLPKADFDALLIAREDGEVLISEGRIPLRLFQMPIGQRARADENSGDEDNSASHGADRTTHLKPVGTSIGEVAIAGTDYRLFAQPIRIPADICWRSPTDNPDEWREADVREDVWMLMGLQDSANFSRRARTISPTIVMVAFALLIATVLILPYLKLRYIGTREALHAHDVLVLTIALVVSASTVTYTMLELSANASMRQERDKQLELISSEISSAFSTEVDHLYEQLRELNKQFRGSPQSFTGVNLLDNETQPLTQYPFLEMAVWIDEDGEQIAKWTIKDQATPLIKVETRQYFRAARDNDLWQESKRQWYIESIRSLNTGEVLAVLSMRLHPDKQLTSEKESPEPGYPSKAIVAVAVAPLLSVIRPVLPSGYGFAVISDDGEVKFHSDDTRNLRENFLEEVSPADEFRAAVMARAQKPLSTVYRDSAHRMRPSALKGTPWTLVTFVDDTIFRIARVDMLTMASFLYFIYLIPLLLVFLVFRYLRAHDRSTDKSVFVSLWPHKEGMPRYLTLTLVSIVLTAAWILLMHWQPDPIWWTLTGAILIGTSGLVACFILLHRTRSFDLPQPEEPRSRSMKKLRSQWMKKLPPQWIGKTRKHWKKIYMVGVFGVVTVVAVLPPVTFYCVVHNEYIELSTKLDQLTLANSLAQRFQQTLERYRNIAVSNDYEDRLQPTRADESWGVHLAPAGATAAGLKANGAVLPLFFEDSADLKWSDKLREPVVEQLSQWLPGLFFEDSADLKWSDKLREPVVEQLSQWLPGLSHWSHDLRALTKAQTRNVSWVWVDAGDADKSLIALFMPDYRPDQDFGKDAMPRSRTEAEMKNLFLVSRVMRFQLDFVSLGNLGWVLLALGISAVIVTLTWSAINRIYLLDFSRPKFLEGKDMPPSELYPHTLELRCDYKKTPDRIDSAELRSDTDSVILVASASKGTIYIDNFHIGLSDPKIALRKLDLLERLRAGGAKELVVCSEINPLYYFTMLSNDRIRGLTDAKPNLDRWSAVLMDFTRSRKADPGVQQENFHNTLKKLAEKRKIEIKEILRYLAAECWPHKRLQDIAERLVNHPDISSVDTDAEDTNGDAEIKSREEVIYLVLDQAEAYYRFLWEISSKDERMVLYHVCKEGFVSWQSRYLVRRLIHRGLLRFSPNLQPLNESFRIFVLSAELPEVFATWTEEAGSSVWARLRFPLILAIVATGVFFFVTQPNVFSQSLAFTTALAAAGPALIKLMAMMLQSRAGSGP